jgi:hypothetical protein
MDLSSLKSPKVIGSVIAVLLVIGVFIYAGQMGTAPSGEANTPPPAAATPPGAKTPPSNEPQSQASPTAKTPAPQPAPNPTPPAPVPSKNVSPSPARVLIPAAGDYWVMNKQHVIEWNNDPGVPGAIALADANTKKIIGWLEQHTDARETSFTWETQDYFLSRNSDAKGQLSPGTYVAILQSDSTYASTESAPFRIAFTAAYETITYAVRLGSGIAPRVTAVTKGSKVIFINNDPLTRRVNFAGIDPIIVGPNGDGYFFNSSILPVGPNYYTSDAFQGQAVLNVQ